MIGIALLAALLTAVPQQGKSDSSTPCQKIPIPSNCEVLIPRWTNSIKLNCKSKTPIIIHCDVPQQKEHKMLFKVEARNVITYIRSTSLEQAKKDYMSNLFGCLREEDVKWTVIDKVPEGEVVRGEM